MGVTLTNTVTDTVILTRGTQQNFKRKGLGAFVQYEGRTKPVSARSTPISNVWEFEFWFSASEHALAGDLLSLLDNAFAAVDDTITIVTDGSAEALLAPASVLVAVHEWDVERRPGQVVGVTFSAQEVD